MLEASEWIRGGDGGDGWEGRPTCSSLRSSADCVRAIKQLGGPRTRQTLNVADLSYSSTSGARERI
jgi:hypothetical protein